MIGGMAERIIAACDGASKGNPGPAGWGWVVADESGQPDRWEGGPLGTSTNNIAELTALQRLLESTDSDVPLEVRMDSQYAMKAVTTWLPGWKRNGWKTSAGKPVANQALVARIDELLSGRAVEFVYVPAHQVDGDRLNAFADRAASQAATTQQPAGTALGSPSPAAGAEDVVQRAPRGDGRAKAAGQGPRKAAGGSGGSGGSAGSGRTAGPGGGLAAKFPGTCRCGRPYERGERIAKNSDGWGHLECAAG
ncbi:ribonuclease H [Streptacidiphilus sp. N1-12]|uniref:Ribonuclease H n=2 Tax=Streptacidiphilus alkalitolerans TaxID=3342712 RepID=A0ABV6W9M4_9ACTN